MDGVEESPEKTQPVPQAEEYPDQEQMLAQQELMYQQEQYFDDGEGEVTGALVATRMSKKKAADDAKLLANRIALLKLEEKKAWKKIEETKKRAEQAMLTRARNEDDRSRKEYLRRQREMEEEERLNTNNMMKEQTRQAIHQQNAEKMNKQVREAQRLKEESIKNSQIIALQKEQEYMKNNNIKEMIRQQKLQAEDRKRMENDEKRMQQRNRLINQILEENNRRMETEARVADLEKEEYELIQRLQNTSNIQKQAYEDLESALNGNLSPEQLEAQFGLVAQGSRMSGSKGFKGKA